MGMEREDGQRKYCLSSGLGSLDFGSNDYNNGRVGSFQSSFYTRIRTFIALERDLTLKPVESHARLSQAIPRSSPLCNSNLHCNSLVNEKKITHSSIHSQGLTANVRKFHRHLIGPSPFGPPTN